MSDTDDDFTVTGYDPNNVLGFTDDDAVAASQGDLDEAVPRILDDFTVTGDLEDDAREELDAVAQGFRDRKNREAERMELATNSDYWFAVCFATQAQRDAFIEADGLQDLGYRYLDGRDIARRRGITLPPDPVWPNQKVDHSWDDYAMTIEDNRNIDL